MTQPTPTEAELCFRLGTNVRALRTAALLTLQRAAKRAEIHWRHWQKIEAGQINATLFTLKRVADALNVTPADLLRESAPRATEVRGGSLSVGDASRPSGSDERAHAMSGAPT